MRLLQAHPSSLLLLIITVVVTSIAQEQDVVGVSTEETWVLTFYMISPLLGKNTIYHLPNIY